MATAEYKPEEQLELERVDSEVEDEESAPAEYEIASYPADFTLEVLWEKWKAKDLEIPRFQRDFVWKSAQASKLIESFLIGLPVPAVFLYTERKSQKLLVVDGQQRLRSVFYFFEGFFAHEGEDKRPVFRLKELNKLSRWYNKSFEELEESDQRRLRNAVLRAFLIQQIDPNDDTSVFHIFERLNTGGTLLNGQQIRNCVYGGELRDLLIEINGLPRWREIVGRQKSDRHGKDMELALRFFSLNSDLANYEKPLKDFMSRWMKRHRSPGLDEIARLRTLFTTTCDAVIDALGARPFHVVRGLNAGVFDAVMVAFARHLDTIPADVARRFQRLKEDAAFLVLTRRATTDVASIRGRFDMADRILFGES
jgi:uncharacterized protein with ParB-like and HNH nuclease domain